MFVLREETTINNFLMYACLNTFCWTWSMSYVEIYQGNDNLSINLQLETEACHSFSSTCSNMDWWFNTCTQWYLRFADTTTLQVPSTRRAILGDRAFPMAAARAWNSLPLETRACSSLLTFWRETKSHLFRQSYGWRGAIYSDSQQTSALSCATVLYLDFCKVPPQLCDGSTLIHDICSSSSSGSGSRSSSSDFY